MIQVYPDLNQNYLINVARGQVSGAQTFGSFGKRTSTGSVAYQLLWPDGAFVVPSAAGAQLSIVSTSANDAAAGTGLRTVDVHYLDTSLNPQVEVVTLNGTTPVLTVATNIRFVQCMHVLTVGSGGVAAGTITASNTGVIYSQIATGELRCTSSARMVPAGKRLLISGAYASSVSPGSSETGVALTSTQVDENDLTSLSVFVPYAQSGFQDNGLSINFNPPLVFNEGVVVAMHYTQASTATVTGGWFGWLENA